VNEYEILVEDDDERRAIVTLRARDLNEARERVRYMLDPTAARIIEVRAAFLERWDP
jgi:hypothetical protein